MPHVIAVILGGLVAIPLSQICLWWIFSTDPAGVGPAASEMVPFAVPTQFHEEATTDKRPRTKR